MMMMMMRQDSTLTNESLDFRAGAKSEETATDIN
jgi:hypothetical protein